MNVLNKVKLGRNIVVLNIRIHSIYDQVMPIFIEQPITLLDILNRSFWNIRINSTNDRIMPIFIEQPMAGSCPNSNLLRNFLFCSCLGIFVKKGGGGCLIPNFWRNFSPRVWKVFRKGGGGVTWFQKVWGTFLLELGNISFKGGGVTWLQRRWGTFSALV